MQKIIFAICFCILVTASCRNNSSAQEIKVVKAVLASATCFQLRRPGKPIFHVAAVNIQHVNGDSIKHFFEGSGSATVTIYKGSFADVRLRKNHEPKSIKRKSVKFKKVPKLMSKIYALNYKKGSLQVVGASISRATMFIFTTKEITVFKLAYGKKKIHVKFLCQDPPKKK